MKFSCVGCLMVVTPLTFLQPLVLNLQGLASQKPEQRRFTSPDGTLTFNYPRSLVKCARDRKQSDWWLPAESCNAYTPVCSDFDGSRDNTIACVSYPAATMKGTNFGAAAFSVNRIKANTADACLKITEPDIRTRRPEKVNGVTFTVFEIVEGGLGNLMDGEAYRSFHRNMCYELGIRVAFPDIGDFDPGTVREFDHKAVYNSLKSVLNTFQFLK